MSTNDKLEYSSAVSLASVALALVQRRPSWRPSTQLCTARSLKAALEVLHTSYISKVGCRIMI